MNCKINSNVIEWKIDKEHIQSLYHFLYDTKEHGGEISLNTLTKRSYGSKTIAGGKDSANAPDAIVNLHTHPISCYRTEGTIWGWPSGEDLRESVIYGLRGSACHVVPAVEGTYTVQPNPCFITSLLNIENVIHYNDPKFNKLSKLIPQKNWGDFLRGFIILSIEVYFKSTHIFRTIEYMKIYADVTAEDFVDFTNVFQLKNMFSKEKISGCKKMECNQIVRFENKIAEQIPFEKYIKDYEDDTTIFYIDKHGNHSSGKHLKLLTVVQNGGLELLKNLAMGINCKLPEGKWHNGRVFLMKLYPNKIRINGFNDFYMNMSNQAKVQYINNPIHSIDEIYFPSNTAITFKLFDMQGDCNHTSLKQHIQTFVPTNQTPIGRRKSSRRTHFGRSRRKSGKSLKRRSKRKKSRKISKSSIPKSIVIVGSTECSHCGNADALAKKIKEKINFDYNFEEYPTIKEAIDIAQERAGHTKKVDGIPAFFVNNKYVKKTPKMFELMR